MYQNDTPVIKNGMISIFMLLFFPLAILMILIRLVSHRNLRFHKYIDSKYIGKLLLVLFVIFSFSYFIQLAGDNKPLFSVYLACILLLLVPGIALRIRAGNQLKRLSDSYVRYRNLVHVEKITSIDSLAEMTLQRPAVVTNDLLRMINLGLFKDCFIDPHSRTLVFENAAWSPRQMSGAAAEFSSKVEVHVIGSTGSLGGWQVSSPDQAFKAEKPAPPPAPKTVECPGCGSRTVLQPSEVSACEYCGSAMAYPQN
ncbi:hypothetical protein WMW72_31910 [Paenibacillus filicis]|uniref:Zinc ribbon domain-containing protein n=1 Tax=Paenibacillus filicis TaxID=669464 RepID=A0ABU9DUN7_9BACL